MQRRAAQPGALPRARAWSTGMGWGRWNIFNEATAAIDHCLVTESKVPAAPAQGRRGVGGGRSPPDLLPVDPRWGDSGDGVGAPSPSDPYNSSACNRDSQTQPRVAQSYVQCLEQNTARSSAGTRPGEYTLWQ